MTTTTLRLPPRIARLPQLRRIMRGGLAARGSIGAGLAAKAGGAAAGVNWSTWLDHCWVAKGAASLSASYGDLVGAQTLTFVSGKQPTLGANGWTLNGTQYLKTGIVPAENDSVFIQFANAGGGNRALFGVYITGALTIYGTFATGNLTFFQGGGVTKAIGSAVLAGNLGVTGQRCYQNGVDLGSTLSKAAFTAGEDIFVGCENWGGGYADNFFVGDVTCFGIKHGTISDVSGMYAAMAAL